MWKYFWRIAQMMSWKLCAVFVCAAFLCLSSAGDILSWPEEIRRLIKRQWESHRPCKSPQDIYPDAPSPIKEIWMLLIHVQ